MTRSIGDILAELQKRMETEADTSTKTKTSPTSTSRETEPPRYDCEKCQDRGLVFIDNDTVRRCDCVKRKKRDRLFRQSGISPDFQGLSFGNFSKAGRPPEVLNMARAAFAYRQQFQGIRSSRKNSILLMGSPGSGKTHLLSAIANELIRDDLEDVIYWPYAEGFDALRSDLDSAAEKIRALKECAVLFIDDLFKTRRGDMPTKYQLDTIYTVINARYMAHLPLLVSTEYSTAELLEIDEATASRLIEMAGDYKIFIEGPPDVMNYRLRD